MVCWTFQRQRSPKGCHSVSQSPQTCATAQRRSTSAIVLDDHEQIGAVLANPYCHFACVCVLPHVGDGFADSEVCGCLHSIRITPIKITLQLNGHRGPFKECSDRGAKTGIAKYRGTHPRSYLSQFTQYP